MENDEMYFYADDDRFDGFYSMDEAIEAQARLEEKHFTDFSPVYTKVVVDGLVYDDPSDPSGDNFDENL